MPRRHRENYDELEQKYKSILAISYGFETPQGWLPLLEEFLEKAINFEGWFKVVQIKEKFGGLRIYIDTEDDIPNEIRTMIEGLISEAEFKANRCCHDCGCSIDRDSAKKYRFFVLCDSCAAMKHETQQR
jgi:hypothetical protein